MLWRRIAHCLQPLAHLSPPAILAGTAFAGSVRAGALGYAAEGPAAATATAQHSTAVGPGAGDYAQAPVTAAAAPRLLARPDPGLSRLGTGQAGAVERSTWLAPHPRQAVWQQRCLACSASQPVAATATPNPLPQPHTPAQDTVSAVSSGTDQGVSHAAEDALVSLLRSAPHAAALRQEIKQHRSQLQPAHVNVAWYRLIDIVITTSAPPTKEDMINVMATFLSLKPHTYAQLAGARTQPTDRDTVRALDTYTDLSRLSQYLYEGIYALPGSKGELWRSEAGVFYNTKYRSAARQLTQTCLEVLGAVDRDGLAGVLGGTRGADSMPRYHSAAEALVRLSREHRGVHTFFARPLGDAVLVAMGRHIQATTDRMLVELDTQSYRRLEDPDSLLLTLQSAMRGLGIPVEKLWHSHMGDATLAALSACPPDQWSDGHVRLLAAWQQSGAAADTPVGTAITQLAAQRSRQHGGQAVAGAAPAAASPPGSAAAVAAAQGAATADAAAADGASLSAATAAPLTVAGSQPAAATAAPDPVPQPHTPPQNTVSAVSSGTQQGASHAAENALMSLLHSASDITALRQLLEQHSAQLQPDHVDEAVSKLMRYTPMPGDGSSAESIINAMSVFIQLQPHIFHFVLSGDAASSVHKVRRALVWYTHINKLSVSALQVAMGRRDGTAQLPDQWLSAVREYYETQYRPAARNLIEACETVVGGADVDVLTGVLAEGVGPKGTPRYRPVAMAISWFYGWHSSAPAEPRRRLCEALLTAVGQDIQADSKRVQAEVFWQSPLYKGRKQSGCVLQDLQHVMHGLAMPVGQVWHTHMGDATLAALSACPPDQWSDGHMRLLAAWQQSGAAASNPTSMAISQLASIRERLIGPSTITPATLELSETDQANTASTSYASTQAQSDTGSMTQASNHAQADSGRVSSRPSWGRRRAGPFESDEWLRYAEGSDGPR